MPIPESYVLGDFALFFLRAMLAVIFASSGWSHVSKPEERAKSIGMSPGFTLVLGAVELMGATSVALGIFPQVGALAFIVVMVGALYKKVFVWGVGFWGEESDGWYYDLLYLSGALVVLATGGGAWVLT